MLNPYPAEEYPGQQPYPHSYHNRPSSGVPLPGPPLSSAPLSPGQPLFQGSGGVRDSRADPHSRWSFSDRNILTRDSDELMLDQLGHAAMENASGYHPPRGAGGGTERVEEAPMYRGHGGGHGGGGARWKEEDVSDRTGHDFGGDAAVPPSVWAPPVPAELRRGGDVDDAAMPIPGLAPGPDPYSVLSVLAMARRDHARAAAAVAAGTPGGPSAELAVQAAAAGLSNLAASAR
eukprot:7612589-Pyramimonas_sp.AAC.1